MKTNKQYSLFQKTMVIFIPIIVLFLVAAVGMCLAFSFLPMSNHEIINTGYATIALSAGAALLAIVGIIMAIFNRSRDDD